MTEAAAQAAEVVVKEEVANDAAQETEQANQATDAQQQDAGQADAGTAQADAGGEKKDDAGDGKPAAIPDNWRELASGGDEKRLKLLTRYGSLDGVVKALEEAQNTIRSGKMKTEMPDAKDEKAMAAWRKEQGIPGTADGYKLAEPLTKRLIDEDKPILSNFMERMHGKHWTPQQINDATEWYIDLNEAAAEEQSKKDGAHKEEAEDALRDSWSRDEFKGNMTLAKRFWEATGIPDLSEARLPDGRKIGSIPGFIMFSSDKGREAFGDVVFASSDSEQRHNSRRTEIEKIRDTDFERYENEGLDKELRGLIDRDLKRGKK